MARTRSPGDALRRAAAALAVCAAASTLAPARAAAASFEIAGRHPGAWAEWYHSLCTGDFNGDRVPDLAAVGSVNGFFVALVNDGKGGLVQRRAWGLGQYVDHLVAVDLTGDGRDDLVAVDHGYDRIQAWVWAPLPGGSDFYRTEVHFAAPCAGIEAVAAADFDGDGRQDLVATCPGERTVSVLRGKGDGTFLPPLSRAVGAGARAVATGDFNRDGRPDVAVALADEDAVGVLLGTGGGALAAPVATGVGDGPAALVAADLDRDGRLDLATADRGAGALTVLYGRGTGAFQAPATIPAGRAPASILAADFDGDGWPDLVAAKSYENSTPTALLVAENNGGRSFGPAVGFGPFSVADCSLLAADFDRDGQPDLAFGDRVTDGPLVVMRNTTFVDAFRDDFAQPAFTGRSWRALAGAWRAGGGVLTAPPGLTSFSVARTPASFADGRITTRLRLPEADAKVGVAFAVQSAARYRYVRLDRTGVTVGQVGAFAGGTTGVRAFKPLALAAGRWYTLQVDLFPGPQVTVLLDGKPVVPTAFDSPAPGGAGLRTWASGGAADAFSLRR